MEGSTTTKKELLISTLATLPITDIKVRDDFNPRDNAVKASIEQLAKSIGKRGLLQPLVVTPNDDGFYLVDGHRRLLACRELGFADVPVSIRSQSDETEQLIDAVTANIQRENLTIIEEARAFQRLREQGKPVKQIAAELGVSQKLVSARLAILLLPPMALRLVESGDLQPGHLPTLIEMAKVHPNLATGMSTVIVDKQVPPSEFAADPFRRVAQGHVPELDVWIVGANPPVVQVSSVAKDLDELDRARLKEIGELRGTATPHAVSIDLQAGVAFGCVYAPPRESDDAWGIKYAVCDRAWMVQAVKDSIGTVVEQDRVRFADTAEPTAPAGESSGEAPVDTAEQAKEQAKEERKAEAQARLVAHAVNLNLGAELFTALADVKLSREIALLLAHLVIASDAPTLFMAGVRFCDPKLSQEVAPKNGGVPKIVFSLPEKSEQQGEHVMEFIRRGDTGEQVIGRLLQVLGMAGLADQTAVAQSNRQYPPTCAKSAARPVADLLGSKLPVPIRERLDEADRKAAEFKAEQAERHAEALARQAADDAREDASVAAILACEDPAQQKELALAHLDEWGDHDDRIVDLIDEPVEE